jgi:septum formation protein
LAGCAEEAALDLPLLLASASPRRRDLLRTAGLEPQLRPASIDEARLAGEAPLACCRRLARQKAEAVHEAGQLTLAADTVVHLEGQLYEKPVDDEDAARILRALSGRWHVVSTAWHLCWTGPRGALLQRSGQRSPRVRFRALTEAQIRAYISTGEGRDKAGAYGIQGLGAALVAEVRGSYSAVVGLPVEEVLQAIAAVQGGQR